MAVILMRIPAPAKINLHLRVGPPGGDGFHPLLSWMVTVGLFDTLTLVRRPPIRAPDAPQAPERSGGGILTLSCDDPNLPVDGRNLVVGAATALADSLSHIGKDVTDDGMTPVSAFLVKRIPSGAGLGGGSSDAAAALIGLNRMWKLDFDASRLSTIAAGLGSDVPFFLRGPSSICGGRGEVVRPTASPDICRWAVLVLPKIGLPTPVVYRRFDELDLGRQTERAGGLSVEPDWLAWSKLPAEEILPHLRNDLEPAAFDLHPELAELRQLLQRHLGRIVRMSGSGSSLFTLCDDAEKAHGLAQQAHEVSGIAAMAVPVAPKIEM